MRKKIQKILENATYSFNVKSCCDNVLIVQLPCQKYYWNYFILEMIFLELTQYLEAIQIDLSVSHQNELLYPA